jgi:hypothetical protein
VKFPLIHPSLRSLAWVPTAVELDGAFISNASFASADREALLFDLSCRSSEQFLHLDQPEAVQNGDVPPIGTWLANLTNPEEDSFGAFYLDGDASPGDSWPSLISDALLNQLPARADFDTDASLDAGDFVTPSACLVAGNSPPIVAVLSSSMNSSSWTAGSATPYDDRGGMANSQSVPDGFYISGPGYGQLSGYSPTVFTHSDLELVGSDRPQTVVGIPSTRTSAESFSAIGIASSGINITANN